MSETVVPVGVLRGIEDLKHGNTANKSDLEAVIE